jgi:hypothetical protein
MVLPQLHAVLNKLVNSERLCSVLKGILQHVAGGTSKLQDNC